MKKLFLCFLLVLPQITIFSSGAAVVNNPGQAGPYLDQKPPGLEPEIFAPGIISRADNEEAGVIAWDNGRHLLVLNFGSDPEETVIRNGEWTPLEQSVIFEGISHMQTNISPDGKRFVFNVFKRNRETPGGMDAEIWINEKAGNNWGKIRYAGVNGMYPYLDKDNSLYYSSFKNGLACIAVSTFKNGSWGEAEVLTGPLNSEKELIHPCVAPDGSWIIANSEHEDLKRSGNSLFISFKTADGGWSEPRNLGTDFMGGLKRVSTDGKYLFFSRNGDIYWASVEKIVEKFGG